MSIRLIDDYLDAAQAGEHLSLHRRTIIRFAREKRLRHRRIGQRYYFLLDDLKAFVEGTAVAPKQRKGAGVSIVKVNHLKTS